MSDEKGVLTLAAHSCWDYGALISKDTYETFHWLRFLIPKEETGMQDRRSITPSHKQPSPQS